ncbi:VCAM1 protein, partial [Polypterus senegalus]|nr:VCAM1 protein [Polypterus senegalus]
MAMHLIIVAMVTFVTLIRGEHLVIIAGKTIAEVGTLTVIECQSSGCDAPEYWWSTVQDIPMPGSPENNRINVTPKVEDDGYLYVCNAKCGNEIKQKQTKLIVFALPSPAIQVKNCMEDGVPAVTLTCSVDGVYSQTGATIQWLHGDRVLKEEEFGDSAVTSEYRMSPQNTEVDIVCRVTVLVGDDDDKKTITKSSSILPSDLCKYEVIIPSETIAEVGTLTMIKCRSAGCDSPDYSWSTVEDIPMPGSSENNRVNITPKVEHDGYLYVCNVKCGRETKQKRTKLTVFALPSPPVIQAKDGTEDGSAAVTLTCSVDGVYSKRGVTIQWLHGDSLLKEFHDSAVTSEYTSEYMVSPKNGEGYIVCKVTILVGDDDNDQQITKSSSISLSDLYAPSQVRISVSPDSTVREGDMVNLSCAADSRWPPQIRWSRRLANGQFEKVSDDAVLLIDEALQTHGGTYRCEAFSVYGSSSANISVTVEAASFEVETRPVQGKTTVMLGSPLDVICCADSCSSPHFNWTKQTDNSSNASTLAPESRLSFPAVRVEDGGAYLCEVRCGSVRKSSRIQITVYAFPQDPVIESVGIFLEGEEATVTCTIQDVYPASSMEIQWLEGETILESHRGRGAVVQNVTSCYKWAPKAEDSMKQVSCRAVLHVDGIPEEQRSRLAVADIDVFIPPRNTTVQVHPLTEIQEGEDVTIFCQTISYPPSTMTLKKVGDSATYSSSDGNFSLHNLTLKDSGRYELNVTNQAGYEVEVIEITVERRLEPLQSPPFMAKIIVPTLCLVTLALASFFISKLMKKLRTKGTYEVTELMTMAV